MYSRVKEFIKNENLFNALDAEVADVPYTWFSKDKIGNRVGSVSTIDHFIVSSSLKNSITAYKSEEKFYIGSDHVPLLLTLNIDIQSHMTHAREFKPSVAWHSCDSDNIENYQGKLDQQLLQINPCHEFWNCRNHNCKDHSNFIQAEHSKLINLLLNASNASLPHTRKSNDNRNKPTPGWNEHVKEHKQYAKECHYLWVQAGKPREGPIAFEKRRSRLKFHYAVRYVNKENLRLRNMKMGEAVAGNDDRSLWEEARKITKCSNILPNTMDGKTDEMEISQIFSQKYNNLYNSVGYSKRDMDMLRKDIDSRITKGCDINIEKPDHNHSITVNDVMKAVEQLKSDKKEENGLNSNHIKYGTNRLFVIIALLFNCMLSHGIAPDELLLGTMIPLIKDSRGKKNCSDNYRALTIGTGLSKLLDIVIRNKQTDALKTSDLQFGFKAKSSTTMCTFAVMETIEYYKTKKSDVHVLLLDASKAFDRVNFIKLFEKMLKKGMCPLTVRLLLNMYTEQKLQVKWNDILSDKFHVTNGVRQGGVLSPLFFSIYIDDLLEKLKRNGIGCHIGHHFAGVFGYADDIILLCPSLAGLMDMIKICEDYAIEHDILFNGKKSKYLVFGKDNNYKYNHTITVNNEVVERCEEADHLGHPLHTGKPLEALAEKGLNSLNSMFYSFMSRFRDCFPTTRNKLFHQYCSSMYGSQLWLMNSNNVEKVLSRWRKYHRMVLGVSNTTHCDLLPLISENMPLECSLELKFIAFYKSIATSENKILSYMAENMLQSLNSTMRKNLRHLSYKYDMSIDWMKTASKGKLRNHIYDKWLSGIDDTYPLHANIIKDMMNVREERITIVFHESDVCLEDDDVLEYEDCIFIQKFLCTL